jgi:hypothetical protein
MLPAGWHEEFLTIYGTKFNNGVRKKSTFTRLGAYEIFHLPPKLVLYTFLFGMKS